MDVYCLGGGGGGEECAGHGSAKHPRALHHTFNLCWFKVGPPSAMLAQP